MRWAIAGTLQLLAVWAVGAVYVRLCLDASDSLPYTPATEYWYLFVAVTAFGGAITGSVLVVRRQMKRHRVRTK
ncbi:hypothetical protein [Gordonia rhizosphera]|uniref:Uncharacterized protein n=1 Tax=Gordonia rhizosphera NBRC 16068 TaxID=1108045 RepID=K6WVM4_9ACTN|nr:hypothetical protein [Gordonia rhizosphera]GAB90609.1 hypothetical protein GORHZ_111_00020 [Gordonia rhizosphera NBRC 16068]